MTDGPPSERLRIVVTGLIATYPFGGVFWDYIQYPLGLSRLGHDVLYLEDTGQWAYDPGGATFVPGAERNVALLSRWIDEFAPELSGRWFVRDGTGAEYGSPDGEAVARFCRSADVFLHLSATCRMRDDYYAARNVVLVDSDPMYTQARLYREPADGGEPVPDPGYLRHTHFATFGENVGRSGCSLPSAGLEWIPTRQPIVGDRLRAVTRRSPGRRLLTTVASWEPRESGPSFGGRQYYGKSVEFERFMAMPQHSRLELEVAMSGLAPKERLLEHGWRLRPASTISASPDAYLDYLASSFAEWSVAKNAYVASASGWFSCRSACYMALGVPVVLQSTGFESQVEVGLGVLSFTTVEESSAAIEHVVRERELHSDEAVRRCEAHFDYRRVLPALLEAVAVR